MEQAKNKSFVETLNPSVGRLQFLKYTGVAALAGSALLIDSCKKDNNTGGNYNLGSGDTGILNYAYALEQLEAAFYTQVMATPYSGMTAQETSILTDLMYHEVIHREFFKAALGSSAIGSLQVNFSSIDFTSRTSVLAAAKAFEDTGVSAYDGAGYLIQNAAYLTIAGKIVSVEARHAALIRNLIANGTFADSTVVDQSTGLNASASIAQVLPIANTYLKTKVTAKNFNYPTA